MSKCCHKMFWSSNDILNEKFDKTLIEPCWSECLPYISDDLSSHPAEVNMLYCEKIATKTQNKKEMDQIIKTITI